MLACLLPQRHAVPITVERCGTAGDLLHRIVGQHLPRLLEAAELSERTLSAYVIGEFEAFLLGVALKEVLGWVRQRAKQHLGLADARTGSVTVVQRFSSSLSLDLHFHTLVLDGVFAMDEQTGAPRFHNLPAPTMNSTTSGTRMPSSHCRRHRSQGGAGLAGWGESASIPGSERPAGEAATKVCDLRWLQFARRRCRTGRRSHRSGFSWVESRQLVP
jgi:hypothetical protein